jgi:hypothetical protein
VQAVTLEGGAMHLKSALLGAVVGGAVGVGVLIAAYFLFGADHMALAVVVAILTGLGVRMCVATKGHASYARGAVTALLALIAFMGGKFLVAELASRQATVSVIDAPKKPTPPPQASDASEQEAGADETADDSAGAEEQMLRDRARAGQSPAFGEIPRGPRLNDALSTGDFLWLFAAALIAYELGRGSGMAPPAVAATPEPTPTPT